MEDVEAPVVGPPDQLRPLPLAVRGTRTPKKALVGVLQQEVDGARVAVDDGVHERREPVALGHVQVVDGRGPLREDPHDSRPAALGCYAERGEALGRLSDGYIKRHDDFDNGIMKSWIRYSDVRSTRKT